MEVTHFADSLPPCRHNSLVQAVAVQPVVVTFHAEKSLTTIKNYDGGILGPEVCSETWSNDHAVVVVGYDATGGPGAPGTYWKLKVSGCRCCCCRCLLPAARWPLTLPPPQLIAIFSHVGIRVIAHHILPRQGHLAAFRTAGASGAMAAISAWP